MYRLNTLYRNVLITPDEVIARMPGHTLDPEKIRHSIEIAEERFVRPVLGDAFYDALAAAKNVVVTGDTGSDAGNIIALQAAVDASFATLGDPPQLVPGQILNAAEFLTPADAQLWNGYLWRLTAECVRFTAIPESYAELTSSGIMKAQTAAGVIGATEVGKNVGVDLRDAKWLSDKWLQDRIDPLIQAMKRYIGANAGSYPLADYVRACEGGTTSNTRKTAFVFGVYDDEPGDHWP